MVGFATGLRLDMAMHYYEHKMPGPGRTDEVSIISDISIESSYLFSSSMAADKFLNVEPPSDLDLRKIIGYSSYAGNACGPAPIGPSTIGSYFSSNPLIPHAFSRYTTSTQFIRAFI